MDHNMDMNMDNDKVIQFYMCTDDMHIPVKVTPGSAGYEFWPTCDITLKPKAISRVPTSVKVVIPMGYVSVIHSKSGLAMEGIVAVLGIIDEDYHGEINLLLHNITEVGYKVLKENPIAQIVVYHMDKLSTIHHISECIPRRINMQVKRGEKGFSRCN